MFRKICHGVISVLGYAHFEMFKQKIIGWGLFEFLEIYRCPEGAKIMLNSYCLIWRPYCAVLNGKS